MRTAYGDYIEAHILAAETATNGRLLSARGRAAGVTVERLFFGSASFAQAYASEELLDYWRQHPRMTVAQFEAQWIDHRHVSDQVTPAAISESWDQDAA